MILSLVAVRIEINRVNILRKKLVKFYFETAANAACEVRGQCRKNFLICSVIYLL